MYLITDMYCTYQLSLIFFIARLIDLFPKIELKIIAICISIAAILADTHEQLASFRCSLLSTYKTLLGAVSLSFLLVAPTPLVRDEVPSL